MCGIGDKLLGVMNLHSTYLKIFGLKLSMPQALVSSRDMSRSKTSKSLNEISGTQPCWESESDGGGPVGIEKTE